MSVSKALAMVAGVVTLVVLFAFLPGEAAPAQVPAGAQSLPRSAGDPCAWPEPRPWVAAPNLLHGVRAPGVASDGRYIYVAGGSDLYPTAQVQRYNALDNTWTNLAPMPEALMGMALVYANSRLYALGGAGSSALSNRTLVYDIAANSWTYAADMPGVTVLAAAGYDGNRIYVAGGFMDFGWGAQSTTWAYDLAGDRWSVKAPMPAARGGPAYGLIGGHFYVVAGADATGAPQSTTYDYNTAADSWSERAPIPGARFAPGSAAFGTQLWVMDGGTPFLAGALNAGWLRAAPGALQNDTQIYDAAGDSWSAGPATNLARNMSGAAALRNEIVNLGGADNAYPLFNSERLLPRRLRILLVSADSLAPATLRSALMARPGVASVDTFDAAAGTPADLTPYDVVIAWSHEAYYDAAALGDALADFADAGGLVVELTFDWTGGELSPGGRWASGNYRPFTLRTGTAYSNASLGTIYAYRSPLLLGVSDLTAYWREVVDLAPDAAGIAEWSDGHWALGYKGRALGVTGYFGDNPPQWSGDIARLIENAGFTLSTRRSACNSVELPALLHNATAP